MPEDSPFQEIQQQQPSPSPSSPPPGEKSSSKSLSGGAVFGLAFTAILMLTAFYVFSLGPVVWLVNHDYLALEYAAPFYSPLIWLHEHTFLKEPLEWYVELWE